MRCLKHSQLFRLAIVLLTVARAHSGLAQEAVVSSGNWSYADIPWGASKETVKRTLVQRGYAFLKTDEDGDLQFDGEISNTKARIVAIFARDRLVKSGVLIATPDNKAREVFCDMRETLLRKYGAPSSDFHFFTSPYYEGDGFEDQAIRLGKATFAVYWHRDAPEGGQNSISLSITDALSVIVSYESPAWHQEYERRKTRATKDF